MESHARNGLTQSKNGVGSRLAAARLRRGLSQGTVARQAGMAASYVSRIENGRVHPTFRTVQRIAGALRIPLDELTMPNEDQLSKQGGCPVTAGACLMDLIRPEVAGAARNRETYTPRQVRLLRSFAGWVRDAPADRQRAMEILIGDLSASS